MTELVTVDIGGTHARFALAEVADGRVVRLEPEVTFRTADHASLQLAWEAFAAALGRPLPRAAAIAIAGPVHGDEIRLTNSPWIVRRGLIREKLGVDRYVLVNDFGAVAHAVAQIDPAYLHHLCGPDVPLPAEGVISVIGPGTGLGVACVVRHANGYEVIETEGGHSDFAPLDAVEDVILRTLRARLRRVSVERIVAGPGLAAIHGVLAAMQGRAVVPADDATLWEQALAGADSLAAAALDRFCLSLGAVAGDIALTQGARAMVIAGGVGLRLRDHLPRSGFSQRFIAKGRFETMMAALPVKLITHPQPGLYGAAAAFARSL